MNNVGVVVKDVVDYPNPTENLSSLEKYRRLCATVKVLVKCLQHPALRSIMINYLGCILTALCQLSFAPLKKPSMEQSTDEISLELYESFCEDQTYYQSVLEEIINSVYQPTVIQELMIIQGSQRGKLQPLWLRKSCSKLLTQLLLAPGGVSAIIRSTMESSVDTGTDWKTVNVLTKIITSPQQHYPNICAQLCEILMSSNSSKPCSTVSVACVNELLVKNPVLTQTTIIDKLLEPLSSLSSTKLESTDMSNNVIITEEKLTSSLQSLHQYFAVKSSTSSSSSLPSYLLHPVSHILFYMYECIRESVSHVTSLVGDLIFCILSDCSPPILSKIIRAIVFKEHSKEIFTPGNVSFVSGPNGGIQAESPESENREIVYSAVEEAGNVLMYLLEKKDSEGVVSNRLFYILLETLTDFGLASQNLETCDNFLGTLEDGIRQLVVRSERRVGAVRLLAVLAENANVQKTLSRKPDRVVGFLQLLLEREVDNAKSYSDEADMLCVALMILEVIVSGNRHEVNWESLKILIPPLEKLKNTAVNAELQALADHIYNSVVTKGVVRKHREEARSEKQAKVSECDQAFKDSCDPLLPVRGHALVKLTELINSRDRLAIAKKDAILCLFQENLKNDDTFIYLAAINGMAALTSFFPDTVLGTLTEEFTMAIAAGKNEPEQNLTRMKIGEVLLKVTKLLGEMAVKYKSQLLNTFLVGVKDVDALVRASSLSNLGEVCRVLGFRIGPILQEILVCVRDVVSSDKAPEPRRAAVMVITLLLQGLEKDALRVLSDDILLLYRALKELYLRETDDATKLHAQLALEEVDNIARTFLFAEPAQARKITL